MEESRRSQFISYGLYRIINHILGPEFEIQIRRSMTNLWNDFNSLYSKLTDGVVYRHLSGSYAEGFRFRSSDRDVMIVFRHIVVTSHRRNNDNHYNNITVLRTETEQTRPGFALLRLISPSYDSFVTRSLVQLPQGVYVSSTLWKQAIPKVIPNSVTHGPCESGLTGDLEADVAGCLKCDTWPESAQGCIRRLLSVGWPSHEVIRHILKDGCHMVAIGGRGSFHEESEWRISFSFAEKTLIHNMNHCQFLCYGLLKIFLKEAIETTENEEKLLCSYFLKSALFWEICNNNIQWDAYNFLSCFFRCFKRLIGWVYEGHCPNFFIPENNMFYDKIKGRAQTVLLRHLITLHDEGFYCLLRCPSLQSALGVIIHQPLLIVMVPPDSGVYTKSYYDCKLICELLDPLSSRVKTSKECRDSLQILNLLTDQSNGVQLFILNYWKTRSTQYILMFSALEENSLGLENKGKYKLVENMLRQFRKYSYDLLHHILLPAIYAYRCGFYHSVIRLSLLAKSKLQQENMMYYWGLSVDKYRAAGGDHTPLVTMMRKVVVTDLKVLLKTCVPELTLEHQKHERILFPPLVIANFLLYLSHRNMGQCAEAEAVLDELAILVTYDDGHHIERTMRAISWTMLGICQEMSGQLTNAYQSYTEALNDQFSRFKDATKIRRENVLMKTNSIQ